MAEKWKWLDTFLSEKEIDIEEVITIEAEGGTPNYMPVGVIVEHMKLCGKAERAKIKNMLVVIDFKNASVRKYLTWFAAIIAKDL